MIFILFQMHKGGGEEKINYSQPWKSTETVKTDTMSPKDNTIKLQIWFQVAPC